MKYLVVTGFCTFVGFVIWFNLLEIFFNDSSKNIYIFEPQMKSLFHTCLQHLTRATVPGGPVCFPFLISFAINQKIVYWSMVLSFSTDITVYSLSSVWKDTVCFLLLFQISEGPKVAQQIILLPQQCFYSALLNLCSSYWSPCMVVAGENSVCGSC